MANLLGTTVNGALFASGRISVTYDTDRYQFNFLRASGSNWWVTNDSTTLGLHVNNVGDKFYFSTAGDFYSDTNGWLSTALAGKSNVGHTHDDRYYTETESDGRFQPLENQRLSTTNSPTFVDIYANEWFRNNNVNEGLYNQATATHFYSNGATSWAITGSGGNIQLEFRSNHQSTIRGYVYADTANQIGFLNDGGSWALRMSSTRNAEIFGSDLTIGAGGANSTNIIMGDNDEGNRVIHCNSNRIGFLTQAGAWGSYCNDDGSWVSLIASYAPIFYDSEDTAYYVDPNSESKLRKLWINNGGAGAVGWSTGLNMGDSSNYWNLIQDAGVARQRNFGTGGYDWYNNTAGTQLMLLTNAGNLTVSADVRAPIFYDSQDTAYYVDPNSTSRLLNVQTIGYVGFNGNQTRDKLRVWDSGTYAIGMKNGYDYGHLGTDEYAMSFQMNDNSGRGFWWGDESHNDNQGAASLTTDGRMVIAKSLSIGEGEAVVSPSSSPLYVKGTTSGADVVGVDGINGRLFTVTDDLSGSLFSVNTIAGLPVIEAFADNTVTIGKYGYATTWSTTGFMTVPNSANIYRDLFINGGRSGDFGNRLIIGTDAATYTLNDSNQRPVAYLHGQYPVLTLNHTVTGNTSHGPTIQFTHHTADKQWVIGSNGTGTRLDIGYSTNTNRNPHNGIDDLNGSTFIRVDNGGNVQLGRGAGRSTWVNDTLYVGASDSGDSHMYFGEDSSDWYGLHWYWDSGHIVYLYGRNAGTDTEIMRYTTNSNTYVEWRRNFHMNNYEINYVSQLHFNGGTRFVTYNSNYLYFQSDSTSVGGIIVRDGNSSARGYSAYFDGSGFGLLNSSGNWGIRLNPGNVGTELFYAGDWRVQTVSGGTKISGNLYIDQNYGYGVVGVYDSYRYQGVFAMGDSYKLSADGTSSGSLYGIAWTHTNVGGQSKSGLGHQALFMANGGTQTAIGYGIWTAGLITTTDYGTSANWKSAYDWGNHAGLYSLVGHVHTFASITSKPTTIAGYGITDAYTDTQIQNFFNGANAITGYNKSNWDTAYGWGNHASAGYITGYTETDTLGTVTNRGNSTSQNLVFSNGRKGLVGVYNAAQTQAIFAMGIDYILTDGGGSGTIGNHYGLAWSYNPNYGGAGNNPQSKAGLEHQLLVMNAGSTLTAVGNGIWTAGTITTVNHGNSSQWNTAYGWGNHAGLYLGVNSKAADSELIDGIDSSRIIYGDGARGSALVSSMNDPNQKSGFFYQNNPPGQPFGEWWNWLTVAGNSWQSSNNYSFQISHAFHSDDAYIRRMTNGTAYSWRTLITSGNIGSQSVSYATTAGSATTAGALSSMNISQFTNNSGYITGYTETDTLNSVTGRGASTTNDITIGGLTVGGSLSYGTYTTVSNYVTGADNILLKGNSSGVSGIFFESEKNGTNINHPSDFGFIQYHAYGIGGSSGEANRLVIGVSNDADDILVLNPVNSNGLVVRVGAGTTEYPVYHSGNIPTWNQNTTGNAATATIASTVTVNSGNTSAAWYPIVWHSGNTVYSSGVEIYAAGNYIKCQYINTTDNDESGITRFVIKNGDSYHRSATTTVAADIIRGVASGSWGINITGSSATATTANRLERYGVIYGNNWNDYYLNNRFIAASAHNATGTNKPDGAYNYGSTLSYYNSGEDHYQIYVTENSVNSNGKDRKMYYRSGWNGGWGGWRSVVDVYNSVCYIDAAVTATGDITAFSDGRVKENVETLEGALDKTLKLRGVSYNRTDIEDKSTKIGVIAQEILEVVPEVVSQDENGMYAVSYGNITALLIEAIKEQQKQIDELKEIINGLTK